MTNSIKTEMTASRAVFRYVLVGIYLFIYLTLGFYTELKLLNIKPLPSYLIEDFTYYERALSDALQGEDPYRILTIGPAFLYPPSALFVVEIFYIFGQDPIKVALYWTLNIFLLGLMPYGVAKRYGYRIDQVWYWYVICLGFAPFLELLHIGQINVITLFGIFLLFIGMSRPFVSGIGLALAVLTKVSPLLFFASLISLKQWRIIIVSIVTMLIVIILSALRYGIAPVLNYPFVFQWLNNQFALNTNSQSFVAKLANLRDLLIATFEVQFSSLNFLVSNYQLTHRILIFYILTLIIVSNLLVMTGNQEPEPSFIITGIGMTLSPNIMWYHHYVFLLLPILIWIAWSRLNAKVIVWCLIGLLIMQIDRFLPPYGLLIHLFGHISLLIILSQQVRHFLRRSALHSVHASS